MAAFLFLFVTCLLAGIRSKTHLAYEWNSVRSDVARGSCEGLFSSPQSLQQSFLPCTVFLCYRNAMYACQTIKQCGQPQASRQRKNSDSGLIFMRPKYKKAKKDKLAIIFSEAFPNSELFNQTMAKWQPTNNVCQHRQLKWLPLRLLHPSLIKKSHFHVGVWC